jgi:hypothetical protein
METPRSTPELTDTRKPAQSAEATIFMQTNVGAVEIVAMLEKAESDHDVPSDKVKPT